MKKAFFIPLIIILLLSCRERNSMLDIGSEDFVPPPPIDWAWVSGAWYDTQYGHLIGVRVQVDFFESFQHDALITQIIYLDDTGTECVRVEYTVRNGDNSYYVDMFCAFGIGIYSIRVFFAEMPIGTGHFQVVPGVNNLVVLDDKGNECPAFYGTQP